MNLAKQMAKKTTVELIKDLECPDKFSEAAFKAMETELYERQLPKEELMELASAINVQRVGEYLVNYNPINEELMVLKSYFLSEEEMREITKQELEKMMSNRAAFRFNVMQYAMGG